MNKKTVYTFLTVAIMIIIAYMLRIIDIHNNYRMRIGMIRSFIYIGLYISWGFSILSRIIQTQIRRYMTCIAFLMVFWFSVRTVKYFFIFPDVQTNESRYLWYLYYLPMLFIPTLSLLVALSIGKPENYRLPKQTAILFIPALILFLMVITNDLHQLVFTFPTDSPVWKGSDYGYAFGYFLVACCMTLSVLAMLILLYVKCRIPNSRKRILLPCIPLIILFTYTIFYYLEVDWLRFLFGDMTAIFCLLYAATLEICIQCRFIQSNSNYEYLFSSASNIQAQVTDEKYNIKYISKDAPSATLEQMHEAENAPIMLHSSKRLHNMLINGGYAIWTEDMSELMQLKEKLEDRKEELKERNALLQYEYEREKEHKVVEEQNRLYDLLQSKTQRQIDEINRLVFLYQRSDSAEEKKYILTKISILGSYVKRRKDFVLSIDSTPDIAESKLTEAFAESFRSLALMNIQGKYLVHTGKAYLNGNILTLAYDFFEDIVELLLDTIHNLNVRVSSVNGKLRISILVDCDGDFSVLMRKYPNILVSKDENEADIILVLEENKTI